ncbi:GSCOCG00013565001-RA-CDS, partial [Cotesia congregata]
MNFFEGPGPRRCTANIRRSSVSSSTSSTISTSRKEPAMSSTPTLPISNKLKLRPVVVLSDIVKTGGLTTHQIASLTNQTFEKTNKLLTTALRASKPCVTSPESSEGESSDPSFFSGKKRTKRSISSDGPIRKSRKKSRGYHSDTKTIKKVFNGLLSSSQGALADKYLPANISKKIEADSDGLEDYNVFAGETTVMKRFLESKNRQKENDNLKINEAPINCLPDPPEQANKNSISSLKNYRIPKKKNEEIDKENLIDNNNINVVSDDNNNKEDLEQNENTSKKNCQLSTDNNSDQGSTLSNWSGKNRLRKSFPIDYSESSYDEIVQQVTCNKFVRSNSRDSSAGVSNINKKERAKEKTETSAEYVLTEIGFVPNVDKLSKVHKNSGGDAEKSVEVSQKSEEFIEETKKSTESIKQGENKEDKIKKSVELISKEGKKSEKSTKVDKKSEEFIEENERGPEKKDNVHKSVKVGKDEEIPIQLEIAMKSEISDASQKRVVIDTRTFVHTDLDDGKRYKYTINTLAFSSVDASTMMQQKKTISRRKRGLGSRSPSPEPPVKIKRGPGRPKSAEGNKKPKPKEKRERKKKEPAVKKVCEESDCKKGKCRCKLDSSCQKLPSMPNFDYGEEDARGERLSDQLIQRILLLREQ